MNDLITALKTLLADSVTLTFQAWGCHWNVEGPDFYQYHGLFSDIYSDVDSAIDPLAENIRKLGGYAPFDLAEFVKLRSIDFSATKPDAKTMANMLKMVNDQIIESIDKAFKAAEAANEQGIMDFLAGRDDMHKKWRWFLKASTK